MNECRRICEQLVAYADGTLSPAERAEITRHLEKCPPCRTVAGRECGARDVLRACAERLRTEPVPPGLRTRCHALSCASDRDRPIWLRRLVPLTLVATLIVFTGSLFSFVTRHSDALLAAQLTADHLKCFDLFRPADGATLDAAQAERMLVDRYGWDIHVPPSSKPDALQLVTARRCLYVDGRIPHLMYRVNGQDVSLFVLQGERRQAAELTTLGYHARIWSRGGNTFVLVSPAAEEQVASAVEYVRQDAH